MNLLLGDCLERLKELPDNSVDACVTDPPYGLSFMGKKWDYDVPSEEVWREVLRVLKPGGHLLAFAGTRTYHRMAVRIEDAGFEIRDCLQWLYGQGFPKSLDISKAIDKMKGLERERVPGGQGGKNAVLGARRPGEAISGEAIRWNGWGTALKPANEPICLARKPISEKNIAENVLKWGTGGLNVDGCRIECARGDKGTWPVTDRARGWSNAGKIGHVETEMDKGRFPANILLDQEAAAALDEQSGVSKSTAQARNNKPSENLAMAGANLGHVSFGHSDSGGASRFFYVAKVSSSERNAGLERMPERRGGSEQFDSRWKEGTGQDRMPMTKNHHPTVKPVKLMEYLCRLVTPAGGIVLDPFMGSGSTGIAAKNLGFRFIGIEREPEYHAIASARIEAVGRTELFAGARG